MSVFNGASMLEETIQSILAQKAVALEFIAINDGSTDESAKILDQYAERDDRVRVLHQENKGLTRSLIRGCELARGHLIARQDAGDVSRSTRLRRQKEFLDKNHDCSFVSCWTVMVGPAREYLFTSKGSGRASCPIDIVCQAKEGDYGLLDGPTHHGSVMFRKAAYVEAGGYRSAFYFGQDWDLWYRLAALGKFGMVEQSLLCAHVSPTSISSLERDRQQEYAAVSHRAFELRTRGMPDDELLRQAEQLRPHKQKRNSKFAQSRGWYFIGKCLVNNNDPRASRYFFKAISSNPFFLPAWWWAAFCLMRTLS